MDAESQSFPLHEAARDGKPLTVRNLLKDDPKLVNQRDLDNRVALHWAVSANDKEIVSLLLNPTKISKSNSELPISKSFEIDIDEYVDDAGWTPLHIAASIGNLEIIELLVKREPAPDLNLATNNGQTVIHLSVSKNFFETTNYFLKNGASARLKDKKGQTPLFRAAAAGSLRLINLLAKDGKAQLNVKDSFGWTALHHALAEGNGDAAIELVKLGADPNIRSSEDETAIQVSVDEKIASYFRHHMKELGIELDENDKQ